MNFPRQSYRKKKVKKRNIKATGCGERDKEAEGLRNKIWERDRDTHKTFAITFV